RLTATASVRARYWREAARVHAASPWLGSGADAYNTLRLRYRTDLLTVRHAHSYVMQTLADLGWVGLGVSLLAFGAWLVATVRAPLAVEPLCDRASMERGSGDARAAGRALADAAALEPATAEAWRRLGHFRLDVLHDVEGARRAFGAALYLDPLAPQSKSD